MPTRMEVDPHVEPLIHANIALIFIGLLFLSIRIWALHVYSRARFAADDLVAILSYILTSACTGIEIGAYIYTPVNVPSDGVIPPDEMWRQIICRKFYSAGMILEPVAAGTMRLIFLFTYLRIFSAWPNSHRLITGLIAFLGCWMLPFFITEVCLALGVRMNVGLLQTLETIMCPVADVACLLPPIYFIRGLQLTRKQRIWLLFLFTMAGA